MPNFTHLQGQYLAFLDAYTKINGRPPAEADFQRYFKVTPPAVHQMILTLDRLGLIYAVAWPSAFHTAECSLRGDSAPQVGHRLRSFVAGRPASGSAPCYDYSTPKDLQLGVCAPLRRQTAKGRKAPIGATACSLGSERRRRGDPRYAVPKHPEPQRGDRVLPSRGRWYRISPVSSRATVACAYRSVAKRVGTDCKGR